MRGDFLASFCFVSEQDISTELPQLEAFAQQLVDTFKYYEVIYVVGESQVDLLQSYATRLSTFRNIRVLVVPSQVNIYRRRVVAASEAIGEVVIISVPSELTIVNYGALSGEAFDSEQIVMARTQRKGFISDFYYPMMRWVSGYRINRQDLKTLAVPRSILTAILARPTAALDLRFEPKRFRYPFKRLVFESRGVRPLRAPLKERAELATETISASVSDFLRWYAILSAFALLGSAAYAVYAVIIVLSVKDVQPGWFSTSIILAFAVFLISAALGLISLGVAEIYDRLRGGENSLVTNEISNTSFFADTQAVNVETEDKIGYR